MTCHFIRHISFQIEIVSDKQKTAGGHRPSAVCYPKRFGFKPLNRFQKVSDRSERDETCTCGTCTCTSSSLRCSASSSMLSAFPRDLSVCFDVGIVAPFRPFVKHFFRVLSFFTKVLARTPIAPVHYSLLIIHHSLFVGGACLPLHLVGNGFIRSACHGLVGSSRSGYRKKCIGISVDAPLNAFPSSSARGRQLGADKVLH